MISIVRAIVMAGNFIAGWILSTSIRNTILLLFIVVRMINRYGWYSNLFHLHIEIKVKAQDQDEWMWNSLNVAVSKLNAIRISFDHFVRQMRTGSVHWQIVYGSAWSDLDAFTMLFICSLKASHKLTIQFNYIIFLFDVSNAKRQECQASKNVCWNIKMQSGCSSCDPFIVISVILPAETSFCDSQRLLSLSNDITLFASSQHFFALFL